MTTKPSYHVLVRTQARLEYVWRILVIIAAIGGMLTAVSQLGWQCYIYLRTGDWTSMSLLSALPTSVIKTLTYPQSWIGLSNIVRAVLDFIPTPLILFLVSLGFMDAAKASPGLDIEQLRKKYNI